MRSVSKATEVTEIGGITLSPAFRRATARAMQQVGVSKAFLVVGSVDEENLLLVDAKGRFIRPAESIKALEWQIYGYATDDAEILELRAKFPDVDGIVEINFLDEEWGDFEADVVSFKEDAKGSHASASAHPSDYA